MIEKFAVTVIFLKLIPTQLGLAHNKHIMFDHHKIDFIIWFYAESFSIVAPDQGAEVVFG